MRVLVSLTLVVVAAACSTGGGGSGSDSDLQTKAACGLLTRLADSAGPVEEVDVGDPARFEAALDEAVTLYVSTIDDLRDVLPADLEDELDELEAAALQYRFEDALDARVALDEYAQATCIAPVSTSTG